MKSRSLPIIVTILVLLAVVAAGISFMQGAGLERDVADPEVETLR